MSTRYAAALGVCLAGVALLAGCGDQGSSAPAPTGEVSAAGLSSAKATQERALPERVVVCEPGMVDTALTVDEVPKWPGPSPRQFIELNHPSGSCRTLTGPEARVVYEAAVKHPAALLEEGRVEGGQSLSGTSDALWAVEGVIAWLVVEPQW